ncbi:MAG: hypothetical protein AAF721_00650 [Myxococcota bacterium]
MTKRKPQTRKKPASRQATRTKKAKKKTAKKKTAAKKKPGSAPTVAPATVSEIPGLGAVSSSQDGYVSELTPVQVLGGVPCRILVEQYDDDRDQSEIQQAVANFLALDTSALTDAQSHVFAYYADCRQYADVNIESADQVWKHVQLGNAPVVSRRFYGDRGVYVSLECNCDWEEEHGLQLIFRNGEAITKVGPYDGHLTNVDAFADKTLDGVVYRPRR